MMIIKSTFFFSFLFCSHCFSAEPAKIGASVYNPIIKQILETWPPKGILNGQAELVAPMRLKCFSTVNEKMYVGVLQEMTVATPAKAVISVVDNFKEYKDLFEEFKEISAAPQKGSEIEVFWEQFSGLFFVPNIKYKMIYEIGPTTPTSKFYRYYLKEANYLKFSDGFIAVEEKEKTWTRYVELDFILGDSDFAKGLGLQNKIWNETVKGIALSDLEFKLKSEKPDLSFKEIHKTAHELLKKVDWEGCIKNKKDWSQNKAPFEF